VSTSTPSVYIRASRIANKRATKTQPARPGILDISIAQWYRLVASNIAPAGFRMGGCTMWKTADVLAFVDAYANGTAANWMPQ
jgi:hypothetical protein